MWSNIISFEMHFAIFNDQYMLDWKLSHVYLEPAEYSKEKSTEIQIILTYI